MMALAVGLVLAILPGSLTKPARQIAAEVVPPPGFVISVDREHHGIAIISTDLRRHWEGPDGVQMELDFDDTEAIDTYGVAEQRKYAVEQTRKLYPDEKFEASCLFVVNKKEWILIRTRGDYHMTKYRHFILLTQVQGQYITIHFTGADETLKEVQSYMEFVMRQLSGAKPDDPIRAM